MVTCKETMFRGDPWHPRREPCGRREWKDGMCKTHHPEAKAARKAKRGPSEWERRQDVIATLRAENARLTADLSKLRDDLETLIQQRDEAQRMRGEIEAECEALRARVVWAVRDRAHLIFLDSMLSFATHDGRLQGTKETDRTDADILRAVREARTK